MKYIIKFNVYIMCFEYIFRKIYKSEQVTVEHEKEINPAWLVLIDSFIT